MSYMMYAPARVLFGTGQLNRLYERALPGNKALLAITSGKSVRENGCGFVAALGGGGGKGQTPPHAPLPVVRITTTAGTGSEIDQWGVINGDAGENRPRRTGQRVPGTVIRG